MDESTPNFPRLLPTSGTGPTAAGFDAAYRDGRQAPWDIGRPQPAFVSLAQDGLVHGRILDVGCGTGEHALMAAALGQDALGIDLSPTAIELARAKAAERGSAARFEVADALALERLDTDEPLDTVLDCGFFHVLDDQARERFVSGLGRVVRSGSRYHMLCFSERQLGVMGPRRVTQAEIRAAFSDGWHIEAIEPARLETVTSGGGAEAWLATISRLTR